MTGPTNQFATIYGRAITKYREITDDTLDVEFLKHVQSFDDLTNEIDAKNANFSEFREKRGVLFHVLKTALIPVEVFGNIAAEGASIVFSPSSVVFGAVTYLISAAKGVSASYDAIQDLMVTLKVYHRSR
jgi:hypothetical protein